MRFEQPRIFQWGAESRKAVLSTVFGFLCVSSWRTGSDSAGRCRMVCCAILNELLSSGKTFRRSSSRGLLFDVFLDCLLCVLSRILLFGTAFRCLLSRLSLFTAFCAEGLRGLRRRPFSLQVGGDRHRHRQQRRFRPLVRLLVERALMSRAVRNGGLRACKAAGTVTRQR